ncbi:CheR family methyltransferase [Anatilimnocola floriformis]|uniref:CheR family methyltransferase n=1 Tax=Anatilimnocola floriformis TaxID=2948575 RepID=UPI0020C37514|nr:protein-glutamate O-methyltransferase CheR [Anatilimnocola floriformis]
MTTAALTQQVTDAQLSRYADLIYERTGIRISAQKKTLLSNRLRRRLKATGITCFDRYFDHLRKLSADHAEWDAFLQEITTHETYLFRDANQWDWFSNTYLTEIQNAVRRGQRAKTLRVWSAACSTGDEAHTIACCIADKISNYREWKIDIVGTDIGVDAVDQAKRAHFGVRAMRLVPDNCRTRFFKQAGDGWDAQPVLTQWTSFKQHNLLQPLRAALFDVIFVKNVLIYFDADSKQPVMRNVEAALKPGGMLVTGPAEGVADLTRGFERLQSWLHRKPELRTTQGLAQGTA